MARLPELIGRAQGAPAWASILKEVDAGAVTSREALARLPVTRKADLVALQEQAPPFGGLASTSARSLRRWYMSPGPVFEPQGEALDWWRAARPMHALGLRAGHVVQNCFSYHFTPAAFMIEGGAQRLGCPVIPAGSGQTEMQVLAMRDMRPDAYTGTPSFLKLIVEKAASMGADISSVKRALVSAEALPASLRNWLQDNGVSRVLQFYGSADIGSIAYETCSEDRVHAGMVLDEDIILEIVRPNGMEPVPEGDVGEIVVTSFNPDYPMIRWGTGDLSATLAGISPCGRTNVRIKGWMGRADQAAKVRGMFVHAAQVADIARRCAVIGRARLVISNSEAGDDMTLHCETADPIGAASSKDEVIAAIRDVTKMRGDVTFVPAGSLPDDGRAIEDLRRYD